MDLLLGGILLDDYDVLIVDEAHQLEKSIQDAFTKEIKGSQVRRLVKDIEKEFKGFEAVALEGEKPIGPDLLEAFGRLFGRASQLNPHAKDEIVVSLVDCQDEVLDVLEQLERAEHFVNRRADKENDQQQKLTERLGKLADALTEMSSKYRDNTVCWLKRETRDGETKMVLKTAPISVAPILGSLLFNQGKSVILTSATISTGGDFVYFKSNMGVETRPGMEMIVGSPFDYERNSALYIPNHIPDPPKGRDEIAARLYQNALWDEIKDLIEMSGGRAFCLFTSKSAMQQAYQTIAPRIRYPSRMQEDGVSKQVILDWFDSTAYPVLFATASFWEGVDVPGDALRGLVIAKLPFRVPTEPVTAAHCEAIEARGGNAFADYMLPHASLRLKQGFGRLIRTGSDRGVVVVADPRIVTKGYGRGLLDALPPARRLVGRWGELCEAVGAFYGG